MDFVQGLELYELLMFIAAGLAILFFGYRIKKIAFFIMWFLLGYSLIGFLMPAISHVASEIVANELYRMLLPISGGLVLALLGFSIEKFCVGGICFTLAMLLVVKYFGTDWQTLAIGAVAGMVAAGAAIALIKPAVIIASSGIGAYALTLVIFALVSNLSFETYYWPLIIVIAMLGVIFQFKTTKQLS